MSNVSKKNDFLMYENVASMSGFDISNKYYGALLKRLNICMHCQMKTLCKIYRYVFESAPVKQCIKKVTRMSTVYALTECGMPWRHNEETLSTILMT